QIIFYWLVATIDIKDTDITYRMQITLPHLYIKFHGQIHFTLAHKILYIDEVSLNNFVELFLNVDEINMVTTLYLLWWLLIGVFPIILGWAKNVNSAYKKEKKIILNRLDELDKKVDVVRGGIKVWKTQEVVFCAGNPAYEGVFIDARLICLLSCEFFVL
ncbi:hypothetical protein ACJX0J_021867, partial [Zea mays]